MHNQLLIFVFLYLKWAHIFSVSLGTLYFVTWNFNQSLERIVFGINSDGGFVISIDKAKFYIIQLTTLERFFS